MSEIKKLDSILRRIIKEEFANIKEEDPKTYVGQSGANAVKKDSKYNQLQPDGKKAIDDKLKKGHAVSLEEKEEETPDELQEGPCGSCVAGKLAEIMEELSAITEAGKDEKHKKLAVKAMKYMESAKTALEALTSHESMLEEKDTELRKKDATKQLKGVQKQISKIVKDQEIAERVMKKMPVEKLAELKKKMKGDLDEEKLAKVMLKHSLKESFDKK